MSEEKFTDHEDDAPIEYLEVAECEEMLGGPVTEAGFYLHPLCSIGCCKSEGPFPTREAALEADSIRWEEIAESLRNRKDKERGTEAIEPF